MDQWMKGTSVSFMASRYQVYPKNGNEQNKQNKNVCDGGDDLNDNSRPTTSTDRSLMVLLPASKEACIVKIYRETVYYPFIHKIHTKHYRMDGNCPSEECEVPTNLTSVCWMGG